MQRYQPRQIIVETDAADLPFTRKILDSLPEIPVEYVDRFDLKNPDLFRDKHPKFTEGKKSLLLKRYPGPPVKLCPGYSPGVVCCNYHVLDFIENCPLECVYCILQAYHKHPVVTFHVNVEEILSKIAHTLESSPDRHFRIGTGEHSDSLALDHLFQLNATLVEFFGKFPNVLLELKTKSNFIDPLLGREHNRRTVVSWSVNSEAITAENEFKTASQKQRIEAAKRVIQDGYKVAFHFDPLIEHENWQENYRQAVKNLSEEIPEESIAWISMGTLRYIPQLKEIAETRFPKNRIFANEFISGSDGKRRYFSKIREELLGTVGGYIKEYFPQTEPYLCMENSSTWKKSLNYVPSETALEESLYTEGNRSILV